MSLLFLKVWHRNRRVWQEHIAASLIGNLGQPFLFLLAMGYGLKGEITHIEGLTYLQFIAPGLVTSAVMYSAAFETTYGSYTRLSTQRTFEGILMTPLSAPDLALGEVVWGATKGLISGLIMFAALPLFGVIPSPFSIFLVPVLFLEGMAFSSLGLMMTALARNYEFFNYFTSLLITPLFLFSGIFFPVRTLAPWIGGLLFSLPLAPVVEISRILCHGLPTEGGWSWLLVTAAYATGLTRLAMTLLERRLVR